MKILRPGPLLLALTTAIVAAMLPVASATPRLRAETRAVAAPAPAHPAPAADEPAPTGTWTGPQPVDPADSGGDEAFVAESDEDDDTDDDDDERVAVVRAFDLRPRPRAGLLRASEGPTEAQGPRALRQAPRSPPRG